VLPCLVLLCLVCLVSDVCGSEVESAATVRRHDYKRSLKKPMMLAGLGHQLPHFTIEGDVLTSTDYVRLVPSLQSMKGSLWCDLPVPYPEWQVEVTFSVTGRGKLGGDGFAFWYTKDRLPLGNAMGAAPIFDGLMVLFDTYDNDNKRNNPYVGAILNDGTSEFDPETDGSNLVFGGCTINVRNTAVPTKARITYAKETLTVEIDPSSNGAVFQLCFKQDGVSLPHNYYVGMTAATGGLAGTGQNSFSFLFSFFFHFLSFSFFFLFSFDSFLFLNSLLISWGGFLSLAM